MFVSLALFSTALALAPARSDPPSAAPTAACEPDPVRGAGPVRDRASPRPRPRPRPRLDGMGRAGIGLMAGGGVAMVVGAGVIVPIAIGSALGEPAPNPANYTAVDPYVQDLASYRAAMGRAMTLGVAGAIVAVVGATSFTTGAILWGVSRRRARRDPRVSWSVAPARRAVAGTVTLRF